jgi:hypothetical protein
MATKPKRPNAKARNAHAQIKTVFQIADQMEEPLREASHFVSVLALINSTEANDSASIAFVATKALAHLRTVNSYLQRLFVACRAVE